MAALIDDRARRLIDYHGQAYAQRYRQALAPLRQAEAALGEVGQGRRLSLAAAKHLYRFMAIKDEYEVARLLTSSAFEQQLHASFEGAWRRVWHLAPPALGEFSLSDGGGPRGQAWR